MQQYDVIIAGGSYAGLSAAMALGRAIRRVLIIDGGDPCNKQTPHSHNFITQDGNTPAAIAAAAREQVLAYPTVALQQGIVSNITPLDKGFEVVTAEGNVYQAKKIIFATGVKDIMPDIKGFAECWGITAIHCPYCHGYEVRAEETGIMANGDMAYEFAKLISNWTDKLTLFTNGPSSLSAEQALKLAAHKINIVEKKIVELEHENGFINQVNFEDGSRQSLAALYSKLPFVQKSDLLARLGCEFDDHGLVRIDDFSRTTVPGVYAAGDNANMFRSVAMSVAMGTKAGAMSNKEMRDQMF
ncbi:NAD(P)/FAD-dependent oxidoreductase [uncultured Chitinophaga sp.]|uniref:NAD(P)/FAD-dependent oxidoreductase n=1 Tax=uncultured Chitinophaga sp. TaxID=339340 RepID=UPI0025DCCDBB|nr:NAD(P)/FAD-dependent oxidoreductase [uncultured Chitinophaga sp.]